MLKIVFIALMLSISTITFAQIKVPDLSPSVEISQKIGLTTATLSYSRPSLRGRNLFGENSILILNKIWRTGANATTKVTFSNDIEINGQILPKGVYALLSTPMKNKWSFHFYPYEKLPFTKFLNREALLEITVPIKKTNYSVETFSLHFEAIKLNSTNLVMQWADYKVEIPIKFNEHESILKNIAKVLNGPSTFDYFQAALYLHESKTDLPLALSYIQKATSDESALFFVVYREALILSDLNRKEEAIKAAQRSMKLSKKAGNDDLVRLNQLLIDKLSK